MKYAIVECGGKQYKAVESGLIEVDLMPFSVGEQVKLDSVLLFTDDDKVSVGTPLVKGVSVSATVVDHKKGPKIVVFRYRPKKRYRSKTGHRQWYTLLKIDSFNLE